MGRLVIASNRVGSSLSATDGGLATALLAALDRSDVVWFGWSGEIVDEPPGPTRLQRDGNLVQALVDLERSDYNGYYLEFANRVLWPVFHYRVNLAEYGREQWATYGRVNEMFAERLASILRPDDLVWVHDYHMIPMGAALRRLGVDNPLGFFLHIPFPAPEVLTTLPVHDALVRSLFAYNLVGFQTGNDLQAFQDYVEREAGGQAGDDGTIRAYGTSVRAARFPISVDPRVVAARAVRAASTRQATRLRDSVSGRRLIIGVDRLDYTKGLVHRLDAVERLLETRPQHRRGIVVLQIAPPSREDVPEYRQIRAELDARIGRINGRFAEPDQLPLRYVNRRFRQETLFGFYRASRVALVTPLRDGMNLVAKEFVASQDPEDPGVLILSRFAGAARELDTALIINPFDVDQIVDALDQALGMPVEERRARWEAMMSWLQEHDVHVWRESFLKALQQPGSMLPGRPTIPARRTRHGALSTA
ncbi:MAG TPA: trehalose-6-phosphate synthase [Steroidobacteraceae bacterium]|nr:trehalose-6-phosphate synthase [Steroidobacteraceae bacterium]